jgi:predicted DNA-binding protein
MNIINLDALLKNESLYNNIRKVQMSISDDEPRVEEPVPPLSKKIGKISKKFIQKIINQYIEALYTLKISQDLETIFKAFEPQAKAAREAEEKAVKEAFKRRRKNRGKASLQLT